RGAIKGLRPTAAASFVEVSVVAAGAPEARVGRSAKLVGRNRFIAPFLPLRMHRAHGVAFERGAIKGLRPTAAASFVEVSVVVAGAPEARVGRWAKLVGRNRFIAPFLPLRMHRAHGVAFERGAIKGLRPTAAASFVKSPLSSRARRRREWGGGRSS